MDTETYFIGLAFDEGRADATPRDARRLVQAVERQGFRTAPASNRHSVVHVWCANSEFSARLTLGNDWMVQIAADARLLDMSQEVNRPHLAALITLIGISTATADSYLGFISTSTDDDLCFVVEDPPVRLEQPMTMVYLGRRYLVDWPNEPAFAEHAELVEKLPDGRLFVPSLAELG